ncbi:Ig-like domain-containing protein [Nocardioides aestuarii]|uniref:Ig-like domain-containing protein n=1 Tax=Nocardioides aestuarii TaxID=252231 RepID=A0ABW4TJ12_9ACTN
MTGIPVLEWERSRGAAAYDVQVSSSSGFGTLLWSTSTENRRATPNVQLPGGTIYWRVRSKDSSGGSAWSEADFSRSALAAPAPVAPADGTLLNPPEEPALTSWGPVDGAISYTLQVSTDPLFVDTAKVKSYTTQSSSYVVPDPLVATEYFWRVRATLGGGIVTEWSPNRSYQMGGLEKPVLTSPSDSAQAKPLQDVVLDWEPVLGAKTYNLQISTDRNFNTLDDVRTGVMGTRYSPPITLDNDQYYWRVAPVDGAGNTLDWNAVDVWEFRRNWPFQPGLEYPADESTVGDPFFYQWTPVKHATSYEVQVATSADFSQNSMFGTCPTVQTTYIPTSGDCFPQALGHYYWRVLAYDGPRRPAVISEAVDAEIFEFNYNPALVTSLSPVDGASVQIPTLNWEPVAGASQYQVSVTRVDTGQVVANATTYSTTWTSRSLLPLDVQYRWSVRSVSASGRLGPTLMTGSQPTFTVTGSTASTAATPEPLGAVNPSVGRFPNLRWAPVASATRYQLYVRSAGAIGWTTVATNFSYPAGDDITDRWLAEGTYQWKVEAYNGSTFLADTTSPGSFTVTPAAAATGQRVAQSGTESGAAGTSCSKTLDPTRPLSETQCTGLRQTPVLRWTPDPNVAQYVVWISRDQQLTNVILKEKTEQSAYIPPDALIDSQAGSAFYWHIQPCKTPGGCTAPKAAQHAFNKISKPVELLSPAANATVSNDVTFRWQDYLCTNQVQVITADVDEDCVGEKLSPDPDVEAMTYRIQVDDDPNFQSLVDDIKVDQTTYTAFNKTYPEGPLYWRVQAIDGSSNPLTWSDVRSMTKLSPAVTLDSPTGNAATGGSAPLRWNPLAYAASYDVEVYKNADTIGQAANLVYSGTSKQVALTNTKPLPVSATSYTWRVRPRDAQGRPGQWTNLADPGARFRVMGQAPVQTAPTPGSLLRANDVLFTWAGVDGATDYRVDLRVVGGGSSSTFRTPGLAWAPSRVGDAVWEWRVTSLNSVGGEIGSSPWQTFTVDQTAPRVSAVKPTGSVKRGANFTVTFSEPVNGVTKATYKITPTGSKRKLSAVVKPSDSRTKAVLNPVASLKKGKSYTIKLTPKISDDSGNALVTYSWTVTAK